MENTKTYVDLPAITVGVALALAVSLVFTHFGSVIGLTISDNPSWEQASVVGQVITIGLWMLWIQVLASLIGGYVTGRIRAPVAGATPHEREVRDGIHGVSVWAAGTVLVAVGAAVVAAIAAITPEVETKTAEDILQLNDKAAIILAFTVASGSLVSAVAAWFAATKGGEHRDDNVDFSRAVTFRKQ